VGPNPTLTAIYDPQLAAAVIFHSGNAYKNGDFAEHGTNHLQAKF
jgi:hypothetical protein